MTKKIILTVLAALALLVATPAVTASAAPSMPGVATRDIIPDPIKDILPGPIKDAVNNCRESPEPASHFDSFASNLGDPPEEGTVGVYGESGFAGFRWHTYDLGCNPLSSWSATTMDTWLGNSGLRTAEFIIAVNTSAQKAILSDQLFGPFDQVVSKVTDGLAKSVFQAWLPIMLMALALLVFWWTRRADMAKVGANVGLALVVMVGCTAILQAPTQAVNFVAKTTKEGQNLIYGNAINVGGDGETVVTPDSQGAFLVEWGLHKVWLQGLTGNRGEMTATERKLWEASRISLSEEGNVDVEAKKKNWEEAAKQLKKENPQAYARLTGKAGGRAELGFVAAFRAFAMCIGTSLASILVLIGLIVLRVTVIALACFGAFLILPGIRERFIPHMVIPVAIVVNSMLAATIGIVNAVLVSLILDSALATWLAFGLINALCLVVLWFMWPLVDFRRVGGGERVGLALLRQLVRLVSSLGGGALAGSIAGKKASDASDSGAPATKFPQPNAPDPGTGIAPRRPEMAENSYQGWGRFGAGWAYDSPGMRLSAERHGHDPDTLAIIAQPVKSQPRQGTAIPLSDRPWEHRTQGAVVEAVQHRPRAWKPQEAEDTSVRHKPAVLAGQVVSQEVVVWKPSEEKK